MADDSNLRLALARTAYAAAIALRDSTRPGDPGYHDAVLTVGLRWSQMRYWERRAAAHPSVADPAGDTLNAVPGAITSSLPRH